ncbi:MAG TPA: DNA polymerase IV, partial [Candidatus Bathyarchaeia archaeon]
NKLVAKIASDFRKPDGITVIKEEEVEGFLAPMPVRKLLWIGHKTEAKLKTIGVTTIGELARFDPTVLTEMFGVMGLQMHLMARGIDNSEVVQHTEVKSISHETTFEEDTDEVETVLKALDELSEAVVQEVDSQNLFFKTVTVKIRYENFETHTYSKTLSFQTNRKQDLSKISRELLGTHLKGGRKVRLIGVRVSSFISAEKQKTLV